MRVLLIEDDEAKRLGIEAALKSCSQIVQIESAESLHDAILALDGPEFDLIVLDMAIPSHTVSAGQGSPISFLTGGLDVLLELDSKGRRDPCVVITQFPEIEISGSFFKVRTAAQAISDLLGYPVLECIAYSGDDNVWLHNFNDVLRRNGYSCS